MFDKNHYRSDFSRLARIITNNAVGLVLGGGGARGIFHLGIFQVIKNLLLIIMRLDQNLIHSI